MLVNLHAKICLIKDTHTHTKKAIQLADKRIFVNEVLVFTYVIISFCVVMYAHFDTFYNILKFISLENIQHKFKNIFSNIKYK